MNILFIYETLYLWLPSKSYLADKVALRFDIRDENETTHYFISSRCKN